MSVPILLITGFLGAGKTTLINRLLSAPNGRRLAAVVNDFGAINIDAALLASVSEDVISLQNGCICCSLQGDLLQTLSRILRRKPVPDGIVIETSGVSNPAEIVRVLLDPVVWKEAALDAIVCVADARTLTDQPTLHIDEVWRSQIAGADYIALSKTDLVSAAEGDAIRQRLRSVKPDIAIHDMIDGHFPPELLFSADLSRPPPIGIPQAAPAPPPFQSVAWTSPTPLVLARFQEVIATFAERLVRAKGLVVFAERPGEQMLFQLVGRRAMISRAPPGLAKAPAAQMVFLARRGDLDEQRLITSLAGCRVSEAV